MPPMMPPSCGCVRPPPPPPLELVSIVGCFETVVGISFATAPGSPSVAVARPGVIVVVLVLIEVMVLPLESVVVTGTVIVYVEGFVEKHAPLPQPMPV